MFALIESCPDARPGFGWTGKIISLAIHAFMLSIAIAVTRTAVAHVAPPVIVDRHLTVGLSVATSAPVHSTITQIAPLPILKIPVGPPIDIPPMPQPGIAPLSPGFELERPGRIIEPVTSMSPIIGTAPIDERLVDELPVLISHPPILYPEVLRQAGVQGRVMIETVLDTLGRAEPGLTHVVTSAHALFDREALDVVLGSRYRPARVSGRPVRVRVQVPVNFEIR